MRPLTALALAALLACPLVVARPARACGMSVRMSDPVHVAPRQKAPPKPSPVLEIAAAERSLEANQPLVAARKVAATFPRVRSEEAGRDPLSTRAMRVFALAVVRADGNLGAVGGEGWTRTANLEWAAQALSEIDQRRPNDPALQADLGEALARLPHRREAAFKLLDGLAQRDLMGSPHAYAALARLRAGRGDAAGAALALRRCEGMSPTPGACEAPKTAALAPSPGAVLVASR